MQQRYCLEIYQPESAEDVATVIESEQPFLAIHKGDLINPMFTSAEAKDTVLEVVAVEHIIWQSQDGTKHKLCVFTRERPNDRASRKTYTAGQQ